MKQFILLTFFFSYVLSSFSQPFWTEDFGVGCSQGTLASAYTGTNGAWTVPNTGTNHTYANDFFVSATEAGTGVGNCGDGCLDTPTLINRTLHVGNVAVAGFIDADNGASYNTGGTCSPPFNICVLTDKRIGSPVIDCSGRSDITLSFNYMEAGDGTTDNAELWYYDGNTWAMLEDLAKTTVVCPSGQGLWTAHSVLLPSSANNNPNVKIGFRWINNDDATGTDPSFAVDDIVLNPGTPTGVSEYSLTNFSIFPNPASNKTKITFNAIVSGNYSIEFINVAGQIVMKEKIETLSGDFSKMYDLSSLGKGIYLVNLTSPQGREIRKIVVE